MDNQVSLGAGIAEIAAMRYTPAGLPALDLKLEHVSEQREAGSVRTVKALVRAVAFGPLAQDLARQPLGSVGRFAGFLATPRNAKSVVFHIQAFQQD